MNFPMRMQNNERILDNSLGRCSDWIGRESGYADFLDDQRPLSCCKFFHPPNQSVTNGSLDDRASYSVHDKGRVPAPPTRVSCGNESVEAVQALPLNVGMMSYNVEPPGCAEGFSIRIEEFSTQRTQLNECVPNAIGGSGSSRNCQLGPVDVEDLALYFESDKQQTTSCLPRPFRTTHSSQTAHFRRSRSKYDHCSTEQTKVVHAFRGISPRSTSFPPDNWYNEQFCNSCPPPFALCNEERWLQCPASDRCPLYGTSYTYGQDVLPPCVYENLQDTKSFWYTEDEQLFEDYLSNEKRKEKSRDAARYRRSQETDIFTELATALPMAPEQAAHLDKASVMRLAIAYLKVRAVVDSIPVSLTKTESSTEMDELFPKALNGFMLVLSSDGNMIYLSENVSDYLGVSQMDMMGQSVYEYSHPCDHDELRECLSSKPLESSDKRTCSFFLRLKCTLTNKGRKVNLKSASYKVIHCTGRLAYISDTASNPTKVDEDEEKEEDEVNEREAAASLVLVGCPIPHPSNIEIPLGRHTFLSKHSLGMKFTYADEKLAEYLGWNNEELMGQSVFEFYHALDNIILDKSFKSLFSKGQCETVAYRFLGKRGGYAWVVTQATLIHCSKQQKPLSVVCVNYVLSGVEHEDEIYSARQLVAASDTESSVKPEKVRVSSATIEPTKVSQADSTSIEKTPFQDATRELTSNLRELSSALGERETGRTKPLAVTTSTFRSAVQKCKKEAPRVQDGSRKDNTFPRPVHVTEKTFVGVQSLKESLEESLKENDEPRRKKVQDRRKLADASRPPFVFQGKPAIEYDPENTVRRDRPQAVTRHLFAPLAPQQQQQQQEQLTCRPPPQTATASIFAPRTEDMNKGFLTFSEDHPGLTMLKDEPEDLTHLAPTPGDVCVPLEDTPFLSDMLDEFILGNDNYCPLLSPGGALPPELRSTDFGDPLKDTDLVDTTRNKGLGESLADSDPFMYGDSPSSPCSIDPNAVSSSLAKYRQSPERSMDSLGSPTGGSGGEGLSEDEMLMLGISDSLADDELALRAPYIPMSDQDEALELLISDDMVMWSPSQMADKASTKWMVDEREQRGSDSSLAQLLRTDQVVSRRYNDHGGGLVNPAQVLGQIPRKSTTLDSNRWSAKNDRADRPMKRIHTASIETENENKRIRCNETNDCRNSLCMEDHLLDKQASPRRSSNIGGSQLLRRLVSQQTALRNSYDSLDGNNGNQKTVNLIRGCLNGDLEVDGSEDDTGGGGIEEGGGGGAERCREKVEKTETSQASQRIPSSSSVLMNLLVSGCDDTLVDSQSVRNLLSKNLTSPLSVNLDNQMVPQGPDSHASSMSFDHLSPDMRKHLPNSFIGGGTIVSPTSPIMPFENFDYDPGISGNGLLQVQSDLFGTLLDRNLV